MATGHIGIDSDHRGLVDVLNRLGAAIRDNRLDQINCHLNDLIDKIIQHFEREENLMITSKYGDYDSHMTEHSRFFAYLTKAIYLQETGEGGIDGDFQAFIADWLVKHEQEFDLRFVERLPHRCP